MSVAQFDPLKHKRGAHGKFTSMLRDLNAGSAVHLPDGIHVKVSNERYGAGRRRMYTVHGPNGEKLGSNHLEAQTAAIMALNKSAQHEHPDAVGGKKRHESYQAALDYADNGTKREPIRVAEQAAGSAHDRLGQNAAEIRKTLHQNPRIAMKQLSRQNIPQFQKRAILAHLKAEQRQNEMDRRRGQHEGLAGHIKGGAEAAKPAGAKRDVAGNPDKPKASDLTPGVTKLTHSQHGEMIYMGRNATNHHVARKANEPDGKKHIIRLKEITLGHNEQGAKIPEDRGVSGASKKLNEAVKGMTPEKIRAEIERLKKQPVTNDKRIAYLESQLKAKGTVKGAAKAEPGHDAVQAELDRMGWHNQGGEREKLRDQVDYHGMRGATKDNPKVITVGGQKFKLWQQAEGDDSWSWYWQSPDGKTHNDEQAHDTQYGIADWIGEQKAKANLRQRRKS